MAETLTIRTASSTEVIKVAVEGPQGPAGQGVPVGGSTGQVLRKASGADYDTEWATGGGGGGVSSWNDLTDKPSEFPPTAHTHELADITDAGTAAASDVTDFAPATGIDPTAITGTAVVDNDARLSDSRDPNLHSASHAAAGSDPLFDQDLNSTDAVQFSALQVNLNVGPFQCGPLYIEQGATTLELAGPIDFGQAVDPSAAAATTRTSLELGTAATADIGTGSAQVAAGDHSHELDELNATGATNGHVLTANGSGGVTFAAASGGVSAVNSTLADILSVSGSDLVADDLAADKLYGWDDSAGKAIGFTIGSGLSVSGDTLTATASGGTKTYAVFTAEHNQPPATAFATLDTRNSIAVLDYDAATDENAVFVGIMPEAASLGSGLIVRLHWMATTATSGNVRWGVQFERSNTDLDADSFAAAVEANGAANGTSGILTITAITVTDFDGITAGDVFRLKVFRNADDATNDTLSGDAELVACEVRSAA